MGWLTGFAIGLAVGCALMHHGLLAQIVVLRCQLVILRRASPGRLRIFGVERFVLARLCRFWPDTRPSLVVVRPATLVRWHREGFRVLWRWRSRAKWGRKPAPRELRALIRQMSLQNPLWGAPRLHGELVKVGYEIAQSTVAKYMARGRGGGGQNWKAFLRNHAGEIASIDMLTVPTIAFDVLYAFVVLGHGRRKILHVEVTDHPTAAWLSRQIVEAFPWDSAPAFLLRDNDGAYGHIFRRKLMALSICDKPTTPHSPWQNGHVERVIGSIRRECLDHIIPLNAAHLRRVLREYVEYYNDDRTHLALGKDAPNSRAVEAKGKIVKREVLGGLHHRYGRWRG
jgi:transposase InsO family protein